MVSEKWAVRLQLIFDCLLVIATAGIWCANWQYTRVTTQSARPWVYRLGIDTTTPHFGCAPGETNCTHYTLVADEPLNIIVDYRNFGPTPARHVAVIGTTLRGLPPPLAVSDWTDNTAPSIDCSKLLNDVDFGIFVPGFAITSNIPNNIRLALSQPDLAEIVAGRAGFYYRSCIYYEDAGGTPYHMVLCSFFQHEAGQAVGTFQECPKGEREY